MEKKFVVTYSHWDVIMPLAVFDTFEAADSALDELMKLNGVFGRSCQIDEVSVNKLLLPSWAVS